MINLRLDEDGAYVEIVEKGISQWRHITITDLVHSLNKSIGERVTEEIVTSPVLPVGTIGYTTYSTEKGRYTLTMFREACRSTLLYENRKFKNVGLPATVYRIKVATPYVTNISMWALPKDAPIRPETELYCYPVYNVGGTGSLCVGMNRLEASEPWELFKIPSIIEAMPSTNAYPSRNNSGLERDSLYKAIQGKDFPDEWLTPAKITLGNIMKEV